VSDLAVKLRDTPLANLFVIEVSKTALPSGHRTIDGVSLVRADRECRAQYLTERDDYSDLTFESLDFSHLDTDSLAQGASHRTMKFPPLAQAAHRPLDHLVETDLVRHPHSADRSDVGFVPTVAALLFFGKEAIIKEELPSAETVFVIESSVANPLTSSNSRNIVSSIDRYVALVTQQVQVSRQRYSFRTYSRVATECIPAS